MDIAIKNETIQRYMGWERKWINEPGDYVGWALVNKDTNNIIRGITNEFLLPFSTDWNYLMDAINKITGHDETLEEMSDMVYDMIIKENEQKG